MQGHCSGMELKEYVRIAELSCSQWKGLGLFGTARTKPFVILVMVSMVRFLVCWGSVYTMDTCDDLSTERSFSRDLSSFPDGHFVICQK